MFSDLPENIKVPYSEESVKDGTVIKKTNPFNKKDFDSVFSKVKSDAENQCIRKIPGQAYADFYMEFDFDEVRQMWYYPVYHIVYEFKKQKYECLVSGCQEGRVYGKHDPEDISIQNIKQQYDSQYSNLKDKKKKCWLKFVWIWLGTCAVYTFLIPLLGILLFTVIGDVGLTIVPVLQIAFVGVVVYLCWTNYKNIKNIKKEIKKNNEAKKKAILDIVLDDNLNNSEKSVRCKTILDDNISY